jgi:hypothetical protein
MYAYRSREGSERSGKMARSIVEAVAGEGFGAEVRKPCIRGIVRGARVGRWRVVVEWARVWRLLVKTEGKRKAGG